MKLFCVSGPLGHPGNQLQRGSGGPVQPLPHGEPVCSPLSPASLLFLTFSVDPSQEDLATHNPMVSGSPYQPAVLQPSTEPSPQVRPSVLDAKKREVSKVSHSFLLLSFFQATAAAAQANLLKQQEELERKAAALERREQELQSRGASGNHGNSGSISAAPTCLPPAPEPEGFALSFWQLKRTTGLLCPRASPSNPASTRTSQRRSPQSTRGSARCSTTCGCVSTCEA